MTADDDRYDQDIHAENAIAAQQVAEYETFELLFEPIFQAAVRHGKPLGEARAFTLQILTVIVGSPPPSNFGLPAEVTDLF